MSGMLPTTVAEEHPPIGFDLIGELLAEQQTMTAVERFSTWHDASHRPETPSECQVPVDEPAQAKYYRLLLPSSLPGPGQQFAFRVDLDACSGCKACVVACHTLNGLEDAESWRRVGTVTRVGGTVSKAKFDAAPPSHGAHDRDPFALSVIQHVTTACHHCEDPGCLNGCPVKAYVKDPITGIVRHLDDQCIGCKYCTMMCPYEVPQYSDRLGIVRKCDMCHQRLDVGEAPACVQSCPNEAIAIDIVAIGGTMQNAAATLAPGAPVSAITRPTTRYISRRQQLVANRKSYQGDPFARMRPQDEEVDCVAESHWPLALMLVATQVSVGMLLSERLASVANWSDGITMPLAATGTNALVAFVMGAIGLGIAPLHLGQPLRSWRVFLGLRTSWLSREAVALGKYMGALGLSLFLLWPSQWSDRVPAAVTAWIPYGAAKAILGIALLLGLVGLFCSAMIYIATRRSLWRADRTFSRFFGTAVVAGTACSSFALLIGGATPKSVTLTLVVALLGLSWKLIWEWQSLLGGDRDADSKEDRRAKRLVRAHLGELKDLRLGSGIVTLVFLFLSLFVVFAGAGSNVSAAILAGLASVCLITGEFAERLIYFQSVVHDRMPGTLP